MLALIHGHSMVIIAATLAYVAAGYVWYSDILFKKIAQKSKPKNMVLTDPWHLFAVHAVTSLLSVIALLIFINMVSAAKVYTLRSQGFTRIFGWIFHDISNNNSLGNCLKSALFVWAGFKFPQALCSGIWDKNNWQSIWVHSFDSLAMLLAAAATIAVLS